MSQRDAAHCSHQQLVSPKVGSVKGPKPILWVAPGGWAPCQCHAQDSCPLQGAAQPPRVLLEGQLKGSLQLLLP